MTTAPPRDTPHRDHDTENFPTASLILRKDVRAQVMAFYRFVRTADDVADHAALTPDEKIARLDAMEASLDDPAIPLNRLNVGTEEVRHMLSAFRQDARVARYADWAALEDYCTRSADPVGRMLLRLHGDASPAAERAADGLCTALQILNHLQDATEDRAELDRVYLPQSWLELAAGEAAFFAPGNPQRREVLDAMLDRVEELLDRASALPRLCRARRLAMQSAMTIALAQRLLLKLRAADPVLGRVALGKADFLRAALAAPFDGVLAGRGRAPGRSAGDTAAGAGRADAALVARRVKRAGSSFARGMATLKGERRRALWAVYAFCRAVDDIADGTMPETEKRRFLAEWRLKLTAPDCALSRELALARRDFAIPPAECEAMVAGMETDSGDRVRLPDEAALDLYCRRVAGSVGAMSVRIFGAPGAEAWGLALGHTFQLTNILRDVDEDARRDRVYVPLATLAAAGIPDGPAPAIVAHPRFAAICRDLAARAEAGFARAERELSAHDVAALRPARVMMWGYRRILDHMLRRGWEGARPRARLSAPDKLRMAAFAVTGR
jgi:phytoene synthase